MDFHRFDWAIQGNTVFFPGFNAVLYGLIGFYYILQGLAWSLLGFTGFDGLLHT